MSADGLDINNTDGDPAIDDSHRRAFQPPRRRKRSKRAPVRPPFTFWDIREGLGYGFTRAMCAIGFGLVPMVSERFGDAGLTVVAIGLAALMLVIAAALVRMGRSIEWRLVADAVTLFVLTPVLVTASGIEVADARLGGRSTNFLAAAGATVLIYVVIVVVATRAGSDRTVASQIGALPGALAITTILIGTSHFSAGALWRGLALAWMVAAVVTVFATFVPLRARVAVTLTMFTLFVLGVVVLESSNGEGRGLSSESSGVAMAASAAVAFILIFIPLPQRRPANVPQSPEWTPQASDQPYNNRR